jgi:PAS domain S-box-containing protein
MANGDRKESEDALLRPETRQQSSGIAAAQKADSDLLALREALRASETRFRSVVEGSPNGIIIQQDGRIVYANPAMAQLFGFNEASEFIGLSPFEDLIADEDREIFRTRTASVYRGAKVAPHPGWRAKHRKAKTVWMSSTAHASEWKGQPAVTSFYFDITGLKSAEFALQESESLYRSALTAGRMGVWETDLVSKVRKWTAEGMALFGLSLPDGRGQLGGEADEFASALHPEDRHLISHLYEKADEVDSYPAEYRIVRPDGTILWLSGRGQVIERSAEGKARRLVSIMADVTEQKAAERHIQFLVREMTHRSMNLLAIIQAIANQTARTSGTLADFRERFGHRLRGLAASHNVLLETQWRGASLRQLVLQQLASFVDVESSSVDVSGVDIQINAQAAQSIGLAIHELATNALKYGALSTANGRVEVRWFEAPGNMHLSWREIGGPRVTQPYRKGFGHVVVSDMIAASIDAHVITDYSPDGVRWEARIPMTKLILPSN